MRNRMTRSILLFGWALVVLAGCSSESDVPEAVPVPVPAPAPVDTVKTDTNKTSEVTPAKTFLPDTVWRR